MAGESLGYVSVEVRADTTAARAELAKFNSDIKRMGTAAAGGMGAMGAAAAASRSGMGAIVAATSSKLLSLSSSLNKAGRSMYSAGRAMTWRLTTPLALLGATAVKAANSFEMVFARIEGLAGKIGVSMDVAKQKVKDLAIAYGRDPQELAEGLYFIASAGVKAEYAMSVLEESAKGAAAQLGDTQTIAQMLTTVMNNYGQSGMTAAGALEVLTQAVKLGKAEPQEFADSLGAVIPMASQLGVSFASMAGAVAQGTNAGLSAARAATGLRFILGSLQRPTVSAKEVLKDYGLTVEDLQGKFKELGATGGIQYLADLFDTTTTKGKEAFAIMMGGQRGLIIANALIGENLDNAKRIDSIMRGAIGSGVLTDALTKTQQTQAQRFKELMAQLKVFAIDLGEQIVPILIDDVLPAVKKVLDAFKGLSDATKQKIVVGGIFAMLMGPALSLLAVVLRIVAGIAWIGGKGLGILAGRGVVAAAAASGGTAGGAAAAGSGAALGTAIGTAAGAIIAIAVGAAMLAAWNEWKDIQATGDLKDPNTAGRTGLANPGADPNAPKLDAQVPGFDPWASRRASFLADTPERKFAQARDALVRSFGFDSAGVAGGLEVWTKQILKGFKGITDDEAAAVATQVRILDLYGQALDNTQRKQVEHYLEMGDTTSALKKLTEWASAAAEAAQFVYSHLSDLGYGLSALGSGVRPKGKDINRFAMVRGLAEHGAITGLAGGGYLVTQPTFIRGDVLTGEKRKKEAVIPLEDVRGKRILAGAMAEAMGTASGGTVVVNVAGKVERPEDIRRELDWWMRSRGL